jgi:tRNA A37 threonylcarbamoyladenosine dehydratase
MRERALGVQSGLTSVANEVVVLVMVGGVGSMSTRGLRHPARRRGRGRR